MIGPTRLTGTVPLTGRPALARFVKMRFDKARDRQVLLGPETVVTLNPTGADILGLCDGRVASPTSSTSSAGGTTASSTTR